MNNAKRIFDTEIARIRSFDQLINHLNISGFQDNEIYENINRMKIVFAVSSFDKFMHDIIKIGIIEMFLGDRNHTKKYSNELIPISVLTKIYNQELIPAAMEFETSIYAKLKTISYQDPTKLADGLSFIWDEKQKWQKIASELGYPNDEQARSQLKLIITRRNAIVHESDLDPTTNKKQNLDDISTNDSIDFLEKLGNVIFNNCCLFAHKSKP